MQPTSEMQPTTDMQPALPLFRAAACAGFIFLPISSSPNVGSLVHVVLRYPVAACDGFLLHRCD